MGMFDSVMFRCPECGTRIEEQSKMGGCLLHTFESHEVPSDIAESIKGNRLYCEPCNEYFYIKEVKVPQATVCMRLFKC
jgi:hypothetical protein